LSTLFVDTSSLAKRYLTEVGSVWTRHMAHPSAGHVIVIADVTVVEMFSLLARRVREGSLPTTSATLLGNTFLVHVEKDYLALPLDRRVLAQARTLVGKYPLRTLDALQLACAQRAETVLTERITVISSDQNLLASARAEGLPTDDPLAHP